MNPLNIRSKKQAVYANALLHSEKFRKSRLHTEEGRRLLNHETAAVTQRLKKFNIDASQVPHKVKIKRR